MQKMQAAAGGKGRGANGMPTPAQIQAMQVSSDHLERLAEFDLWQHSGLYHPECCSRCNDK